MREIIIVFLAALASGVIGGMGMGGGTILIPLLTLLCGIEQHLAQSINLISFIPMALTALIIHTKNSLVDYKRVLPVAIAAAITAIGAAAAAKYVQGGYLKIAFGAFLTLLGIYQLIKAVLDRKKQNKKIKIGELFKDC